MRKAPSALLIGASAALLTYLALYFLGHRTGKMEDFLVYQTAATPFHSHALLLHSALTKTFRPLDAFDTQLRGSSVRRETEGTWISKRSDEGEVEVSSDGRKVKITRFDPEPKLVGSGFTLRFGTYSYSMVAEIDEEAEISAALIPHGPGLIMFEVFGRNEDDPFATTTLHRVMLTRTTSG